MSRRKRLSSSESSRRIKVAAVVRKPDRRKRLATVLFNHAMNGRRLKEESGERSFID